MNNTTEHREIEFKFRVPDGVDLDLEHVLQGFTERSHREQDRSMDAIYFDTANLTLLRWGITLRYRTGGGDDGWHMKVPADHSADAPGRDEIRVERPDTSIPVELISIAAPLLRRQELVALARVHTDRSPFVLSDETGRPLVEIVDDAVTVTTMDDAGAQAFREIEVELLDRSPRSLELADAIGASLRRAGAATSTLSKAAQALGRRAGDPPDVPVLEYPSMDSPAIDALQAMFSRYVRELLIADVGVRRGLPDSVHRMRVACRRLRSALRTFRPLLDADATDFIREELAWLATELGQVRDLEVQLQGIPTSIDDDDSRAYVVEQLQQLLRGAQSSALAALRSDRHDFLVEDLVRLVSEPPVGPGAFESAGPALGGCVHSAWRKLSRSVKASGRHSSAETWHKIRIRAKQARYAVEAVAPVFGDGYRELGKSLAWVTDTLGSRQDAQVAMMTLQHMAVSAPGPIAYQLGIQSARFEFTGDKDVRSLLRRWPDIADQAHALGVD